MSDRMSSDPVQDLTSALDHGDELMHARHGILVGEPQRGIVPELVRVRDVTVASAGFPRTVDRLE